MLDRTFDWYRIVSVQPTSETIEHRKAAAADLAGQLAAKPGRDLLLSVLQGIVNGFDKHFNSSSPAVVAVLEAIKRHDAAVPGDLTENALELRACAAIAVGELVFKVGDKGDRLPAITAALALRCGLGLRSLPSDKHVKTMLVGLRDASEALLTKAAEARRQRVTSAIARLDKLDDSGDPSAAWKNALAAMKGALRELQGQVAADREETDVLWWMFSKHSEVADAPLSSLSAELAAGYAGVELAGKSLLPPTASMRFLVKRAIESDRPPDTLKQRTLAQATADWDDRLVNRLSPDDETSLAQKLPVLLPLSWVCRRRRESKGAAISAKELGTATGLASTQALQPAEWGVQVFNERILQRLVTEGLGT